MNIGDRVKKVTGDYTFEGVVVAVFQKLSGQTRVVVENKDGILHIFSEANLEILPILWHIVMSRLQQILKLAQQTLTNYERIQLNGDLVSVHGYDYIDSVLQSKGFSRGEEFKKNYFYLLRGGERVGNCVLKGDYQRMQIVKLQEPTLKPPAPKPEPKKRKPPCSLGRSL